MFSLGSLLVACSVLSRSVITMADDCNICAEGESMTKPTSLVDLAVLGMGEQMCGFANNWIQTNELPTGTTCADFNDLTKEPCGCMGDAVVDEECMICPESETMTKPLGMVDLTLLGYGELSCYYLASLAAMDQLPTDTGMTCPDFHALTKEACGCVCNICEQGETMTISAGVVDLTQIGFGELECGYLDNLIKTYQTPESPLTCTEGRKLTTEPCGCECNNICGDGMTMTKPTGVVNLSFLGYGEVTCGYVDGIAKAGQLPMDTGLTCDGFNYMMYEPCGCMDAEDVSTSNDSSGEQSNDDGSNEGSNNDTSSSDGTNDEHTVGDHYTLLSGGVCRGPGGVNDKINSMSAIEHTQKMCEDACDSRMTSDADGAICMGYSYCADCNQGECLLFGANLDGMCSDKSALSEPACEALGSCNNPSTATKEEECGMCDKFPTAKEEGSCSAVKGTWKKATWTSAGATWQGAEDPWNGDTHKSVLIAGTTAETNSKYKCYDIDADDHLAHCTGTATDSSKNCATAFETLTDRTQENCHAGCLFTPAPKGPKNPVAPHAGDIRLPGWDPAMSGACRGGADFTSKINGKYSNTAGADGKLTQQECAKACLDEKDCVAYAHSTAWCIVYGPNLHEGIGTQEGGTWTTDNHIETVVTGTKVNSAYICVTGPPHDVGSDDESHDSHDSHSGSHDSHDSHSGSHDSNDVRGGDDDSSVTRVRAGIASFFAIIMGLFFV